MGEVVDCRQGSRYPGWYARTGLRSLRAGERQRSILDPGIRPWLAHLRKSGNAVVGKALLRKQNRSRLDLSSRVFARRPECVGTAGRCRVRAIVLLRSELMQQSHGASKNTACSKIRFGIG